jgi:hypothetical protein
MAVFIAVLSKTPNDMRAAPPSRPIGANLYGLSRIGDASKVSEEDERSQ